MKKIALALGSLTVLASVSFWPLAVGAATPLCFCTYPNKSTFQACAGHLGHLTDSANCTQACIDAGLEGGQTFNDYNSDNGVNTACDWVFSGGTCLGPNSAQTSDTCKQEQAAWTATGQKSQNTATAATAAAARGSVVGAVLPLSDLSVPQVIGQLIRGAMGILGSIAFLLFVYAGFTYLTSQGDSKKITSAKQTMIWAVLGIVIIFGAYAIVSSIITTLTGSSS